MKKKKLKLSDLKISSFVTDTPHDINTIKGGLTGNCGSFIKITCPEPCDFKSIPIDECMWTHPQDGCPSRENSDCSACPTCPV